ncbi:hypothetical protein PITC_037570 [Penicillium italicum]|uniref:Uncharacterized protein n=1 Tax=Penicillium italicum TaxID=40296 RepID=A0A0A2LE81_PENIT|nr:hypothetical protein PITC_037570 [Penicillium italicum]
MSRTLLQASAAAFALLSVGHTWTADPRFKAIAGTSSWTCGTLGWYQVRLLHWQWSRDPSLLQDPLNKAMAGTANVLLWASSVWYIKHGINDTALVLAISAAL